MSSSSWAYVDVERAEFWHFLSSRFWQVYMPGKFANNKYSRRMGDAIEKRFFKSKAGKNLWNKHGREYFPHQGWRLGCNIGWEIAGAGLMYLDHRSVNWLTMLKDSVSPIGLMLYPVGQVIGQSYLELEVFEKQFAKRKFFQRSLGKYLSPLLVERMGVPWERATIGNAASRFLGLGIGTYLSWSLFDLGHNLAFKRRLDFSVFDWDAHKALAMAGFTYGGYMGHNVGYKMSQKVFGVADEAAALKEKGLIQRALSTKLYENFATKINRSAYALTSKIPEMRAINPMKQAYKAYVAIANRIGKQHAVLERLAGINHGYVAAPVNALFCFILADNLPKILTEIEEWLLISEYEKMEEPVDIYAHYKNINNEQDRLAFVDEILAGANDHLEDTLESISDFILDERNYPEGLTDEERKKLKSAAKELMSKKGILFDNSIMAGIMSNAILDEAYEEIDSITDTLSMREFITTNFAPAFGAEEYKTILANDLEEGLDNGDLQIDKVKENLKIYTEFGLPQLINSQIEQSMLAVDDGSLGDIDQYFE